ncbi:MAG: DoxX family protein [Bacteriovorax sp.]|nr:DoxX family protein [Bacteriovorax sp.]
MDTLIDKMETHNEKILKKIALYSTVIFFVVAGVRHFMIPEFYMLMMPNYLPIPLTLIYLSGFFQIVGGIGLMIPRTRVFSAWGLMALLLAVLPANVYLWTHHIHLPEHYDPSWYLMLRIPLQFLLIAWTYMFAKNPQNY